jgi:hypothetical protein
MNVLLRLIQEDVLSLKACLLNDWELIPSHLQPVADALVNETVPVRWRSLQPEPTCQGITAWLKGKTMSITDVLVVLI